MKCENLWLVLLVSFCFVFGKEADASPPLVFKAAWLLTEDEPAAWSADPSLVQPQQLTGWKPYNAATVPPGFNKTIWLQNQLPQLTDQRHVLYFANGLEDIAVYIDDELVYSYGLFSKRWENVSPQRWHAIPLGPEHSHRRLQIRTHYALSYVVRTLYPSLRAEAEVLSEHTSRSFPLIYLAGWFGLLGCMVLAVALMRRQVDLFLYFGLMAISVSSWVLFNQDSMIKPYTGLPPRSWAYFDLIGIYLSGACLISFLSIVTGSRSKLIRFVFWMNWGMATTVALISGLAGIHAWYLLPLLHIAVFPSLLALIPLIIWSAVQHNTEARILMVGSLAIALSSIHDIVRYSANFKSPITTMIPLGGLVMLMAMLMILIRRYQSEREDAFQTQAKLLADIQGLNAVLKVHVEKVEALVEEKTREIGSILGHIQQGIFMLTGPRLQIHAEYSGHLEAMLETQKIAHQSFEAVFLDHCKLGTDQRCRILATLESSLGEDFFNFEVNESNLPHEVNWVHGKTEKILELSWAPIADEKGWIDKILITARDVTSLRQLQSTARRNQEEMQLLHGMLSIKPERFLRFLDSSLELVINARDALARSEGQGMQAAFRDLHTIKGNARSFELDELASLVHDAEMVLQQTLQGGASPLQENLDLHLNRIQARIVRYKELFHKHIQRHAEADHVALGRTKLQQVFQEKNLLPGERLKRLEETLLPEIFAPADTLFHEVCQGLGRLAGDLGKLAPEVIIKGPPLYLTQTAADTLTDCLGHLLRNAMDHGIENPSNRLAMGKAEQGRLYIQYRLEAGGLRIDVGDDGRGLDLQKIRVRALGRGLLHPDEILTEARLEQLIFSPGFSTKSEASIVSGRGVGLDAVRSAIEKLGGHISMCFTKRDQSEEAWHFYFQISLPDSFIVQAQASIADVVAQQAS